MDMLYTYYCYVATQKHDAPTGVGSRDHTNESSFYIVYGIPGKFKRVNLQTGLAEWRKNLGVYL